MSGRFERFTVLISEIARRIHRIKTAEMEEFGLRGSHVSCLYYLARFGPMSAGELCERSGEDKANVSRTVAELRKKGMLTYSATGKRYQSPLELTDAGRDVGERVAQKADDVLARVGGRLSEEDRAALYRGLTVVLDDLEKICEGYPS